MIQHRRRDARPGDKRVGNRLQKLTANGDLKCCASFSARRINIGQMRPALLRKSGSGQRKEKCDVSENFHADMISFNKPADLIPSAACGMTKVGSPSGFGSFVVALMPICE